MKIKSRYYDYMDNADRLRKEAKATTTKAVRQTLLSRAKAWERLATKQVKKLG